MVNEYWFGGSRSVGTYWTNGTDGNWYHYAMVRKGRSMSFYQDGVLRLQVQTCTTRWACTGFAKHHVGQG